VPGTLCIWIVWSVAVVCVNNGGGSQPVCYLVLPKGYWGGVPASVVVALKSEVLGVPRTTRCNVMAAGPMLCTTGVGM
jgi:hypothetical protein